MTANFYEESENYIRISDTVKEMCISCIGEPTWIRDCDADEDGEESKWIDLYSEACDDEDFQQESSVFIDYVFSKVKGKKVRIFFEPYSKMHLECKLDADNSIRAEILDADWIAWVLKIPEEPHTIMGSWIGIKAISIDS